MAFWLTPQSRAISAAVISSTSDNWSSSRKRGDSAASALSIPASSPPAEACSNGEGPRRAGPQSH